jgi:hypothetical protein
MTPLTAVARRTARPASVLLLATVLTSVTAEPTEAAAPAFCEQTASGPEYRWIGGGSGAWNVAGNWKRDGVVATDPPGFVEDDAVVCIGGGAAVTLVHNDDQDHGEAIIRTLDLAPDATLTIDPGGRLYTSGTGDTRSIVRRGPGGTAAVLELQGTLGGIGEVRVDGVLDYEHRKGSGAPAMTTRHCITFPDEACHPDAPPATAPVTTPGTTVVGGRGVLTVSGKNGVNLDDRRIIDVYGRMEVVGPGYIAADDGTAITIRPSGRLELRGNANIYQGSFTPFDDPRVVVTLAGRVLRVGPEATSLVDAQVKVADTARVRVRSGFLSLGGDIAPSGRVRYGASYGLGRCDGNNANCAAPVASKSDPQTVSVTLPGGQTGSVPVSLAERSDEQVTGDVAAPVRVHVDGATATARNPLRFRFRVDSSLVDGPAKSFEVRRRADGSAVYKVIPSCLGNGRPPAGKKACVASRTLAADGDLVVVVRTQVSSRWKIRRAAAGTG